MRDSRKKGAGMRGHCGLHLPHPLSSPIPDPLELIHVVDLKFHAPESVAKCIVQKQTIVKYL